MSHLEGDDDGLGFGVLGTTLETPNASGEAPTIQFGVWGIAARKSADIKRLQAEMFGPGEIQQPLDPDLNLGNQGIVPKDLCGTRE